MLALLAGCASVQTAQGPNLNGMGLTTDGKTIAHINVQNWGFYFLWMPIAAGSTKSVGSTSWFSEDSVNVPDAVNIASREASNLGASNLIDLSSDRSSMMIPLPIPFLFYMRSVNISGNAIK
ncbi:hypothetical protein SDC9_206235 [bioreactor metagenome]|uniref:Uncharacterized protein n=1 Tax=bioreactor metagenome TaxID=1076179 RepID=A0A645J5W8_9ZZZZ